METIERELKMLEEVQKGAVLSALSAIPNFLVVFCDVVDPGPLARNNVVSLLDCVRKDDRTSLIFEFVEGKDFIKDLPNFTERDVARYMRELFIALAHVHR